MTKTFPNSEQWKPVAGYEGLYEVSSHGQVKSIERSVCSPGGVRCRIIPERIMLVGKVHSRLSTTNPYPVVWLRKPGEHKKFFVHRLVADAFIERPKDAEMVNHKNGDKNDARVENLEWCSFKENSRHYHEELKPAKKDLLTLAAEIDEINPEDLPW